MYMSKDIDTNLIWENYNNRQRPTNVREEDEDPSIEMGKDPLGLGYMDPDSEFFDEPEMETGESNLPEDDIFTAVGAAEAGDWREAIETVMSALANDMINNEESSELGDEADMQSGWNIHRAIENAVANQLNGDVAREISVHIDRALRSSGGVPVRDHQ